MKLLRFRELKERVGLGRTTIWRMMREGRFPQARLIGKSARAWVDSEIDAWIAARQKVGGRNV
jgi:prophage regulatory protein